MSKKWSYIIATALIVGLAYFITEYTQHKRDQSFLKNAAITTGVFNGELKEYKKGSNGPWYVCTYIVNGDSYQATEPYHAVHKFGDRLLINSFPVIYDSTNPSEGYVLMFKSEFVRFNLKQPDSLAWIDNWPD